jgi:hypothetical protein
MVEPRSPLAILSFFVKIEAVQPAQIRRLPVTDEASQIICCARDGIDDGDDELGLVDQPVVPEAIARPPGKLSVPRRSR